MPPFAPAVSAETRGPVSAETARPSFASGSALFPLYTSAPAAMSKQSPAPIYTPTDDLKTTPVDYRFSTSVDKSKVSADARQTDKPPAA